MGVTCREDLFSLPNVSAGTTPWLDLQLEKNQKGSKTLFWGDGTAFRDTPVALVSSAVESNDNHFAYILDWDSSTFVSDRTDLEHHLLCQANPQGLDW